MAWEDPKVNYTTDDYFNAADFNRMAGNVNYLHDKSKKLFYNYDLAADTQLKDAVNYTSFLYASDITGIEDNIQTINEHAYNINLETMPTCEAGKATPTADGFNAIENNILKLSIKIDADVNALDRINYILGNMKGLKV